ncbi:hypothetical protein B4U80_01308, partial [Leptotrombidium deliense]
MMFFKVLFYVISVLLNLCDAVSYKNNILLKIELQNKDEFQKLQHMQDLKLWNDIPTENGTVTANVAENSKERVLQELKDSNINYTIMEKNLQRLIDSQTFNIKKTRAFGGGFNFETYNTLRDIESYLDSVEQKYPSKARRSSIGQSYEGREIIILIIRANIQQQKPIVMLECGIHAREWASPATCLWIANELLTKDHPLLEKYEFHIIPVTNPDGYDYTWNYDRLWRKNRKPNPDAPH